ncbi:MAG TPA: adenylyl-sulfate kinase [Cryomorphaceae bacterium]|nr:adenylyl-sulfate kinase [Cryomorphaceae bacterium]
MKEESNNIFTIFDEILNRGDKETLLGQKSIAIWMTGLSGSGKTTIAKVLERKLHQAGFLTKLLDGDNVRHGLNNNLSFTEEDRRENIRRIAEVNKLMIDCGIVTINCFVSPTREIRELARTIIGPDDFKEVFVDTPLEVCERRDVKGLYAKARKGEIKNFTGIDAPFEAPEKPALVLKTEKNSVEEAAKQLYDFIIPLIKL